MRVAGLCFGTGIDHRFFTPTKVLGTRHFAYMDGVFEIAYHCDAEAPFAKFVHERIMRRSPETLSRREFFGISIVQSNRPPRSYIYIFVSLFVAAILFQFLAAISYWRYRSIAYLTRDQ